MVVVGNGMVGHYFARRAVARGLADRYDIVVFGDERHPPYDRVRLGELIGGASLDELALPSHAAGERHLATHASCPVVAIDREHHEVVLSGGERHRYDQLVLATGARPVLPQLPGTELASVFVYRTADDAEKLRAEALAASERGEPAVVVGAGLLGLELAEQLATVGARVVIVESASHLLPRQLDPRGAAVLRAALAGTGLEFHLGRRVAAIEAGTGARLSVRLSGGETLRAGLAIFAVGIRPSDDLARAAGLVCDLFGGVDVDARLATSDPDIYAIGDCARCAGVSYGLVAPGYDMAEVLIDRLLGKSARFDTMQPATRLSLASVEVFAMGESAFDGRDLRAVVYRDESVYRRLSVRDGRVVGVAAVGPYPELTQAQQAVARGLRLDRRAQQRFERNLPVWGAGPLSIAAWPDHAPVCSCTGVTSGALKRAVAEGHCTLDALTRATGAGSVCGSCRPLVSTLIAPAGPSERAPTERGLAWLSAAAAVLGALWLLLPPIPYADTVQAALAYDRSWRDPAAKQITGFGLLFLLAAGSAVSLRKRIARFRWGGFRSWRVFHAAASITALTLAIAHTGLRLGSNFNALLMAAFLASAACGACAGLAAAFEHALPPGTGQRWRARANRLHLYVAWPLPLLITFHVLTFYYF